MAEFVKGLFDYYDAAWAFVTVFLLWISFFVLLYLAKVVLGLLAKYTEIGTETWCARVNSLKDRVDILGFLALVGSGALIAVDTYVEHFGNRPMSTDPEQWGQMGDFFGGMLNPILAFASFLALLYTIRIQSEELRLTKEEARRSADAQSKSAKALEEQLDESRKQYLKVQYHDLFLAIARDLNEFMHTREVKRGSTESYNELMIKVLHIAMTHEECKTPEWIYQNNANIEVQLATRAIIQRLARLSHLLGEYATLFGSTAVYRDYLFQFTEITAILHFVKVLDARFESFQVFNIDEFYESAGFCMLDTPNK